MSSPEAADSDVRVRTDDIARLGQALLEGAGASTGHAEIVVDHLLTASRMGIHSHGVVRIPQYLDEIASGTIDPSAEPDIERIADSRLRVDGRRGFGQVVGMRMVDALRPIVEETGLAMASGRHLGHTGRVGAYPEELARSGLIGVAACNGAPSGHWVAPFGGRDGRISTNPLAMAWPVEGAPPALADFSTGATAEGVIRNLRDSGRDAPDGFLRDADGAPSADPNVLYAEPGGAIQPLGGALGYRGTALGLFVEVLTTLLNGDRVDDRTRKGTDMMLLGVNTQGGFGDLARDLADHVRASPAIDATRPVMMPGDRERAAAVDGDHLDVSAASWKALGERARRAGLEMPTALPGSSNRLV